MPSQPSQPSQPYPGGPENGAKTARRYESYGEELQLSLTSHGSAANGQRVHSVQKAAHASWRPQATRGRPKACGLHRDQERVELFGRISETERAFTVNTAVNWEGAEKIRSPEEGKKSLSLFISHLK